MAASVEIPFFNGADFGVGVDTASGSARNTCVTGGATTVPNAGGDIVSFHMEEVETVDDLLTSMGVSAKVGGGIGLFSASARFNFAQSAKVHSSSVFLVVSVTVNEAFQSIKSPGVTGPASDLVAQGNNDRFREEFGDMFVRGLQSGGAFFAVIQVFTSDETDSRDVSAGLSASYAAFSGSAQFDSKFTQTVTSHRTKVTCYVEGGQDRPLPTSIDTMTARAVNFPAEVAGHAVPYSVLLDDYGVLPLPAGPNFADLQHQKDVLVECARLRDIHQQWLNEIDYISTNPAEFVSPDNVALNALRTDVLTDLDIIAKAASFALNQPKDAAEPAGLKVTTPQFPARIVSSGTRIPDITEIITETRQNRSITVAPGGARLYLHNGPGGQVTLVDVAGKKSDGVVLTRGDVSDIVVDHRGQAVYVLSGDQSAVDVLDAASGKPTGKIPFPHGIASVSGAVSGDDGTLYVIFEGGLGRARVGVINLATQTLTSFGLGANVPDAGFYAALSLDGTRLCVVDESGHCTSAGLPGQAVLATVTTAPAAAAVLEPASDRLLLADKAGNALTIVDAKTMTVLGKVSAVPSPVAVATGSGGRRAYAVSKDAGTLTVIDLPSNAVVNSMAVGLQPVAVAVYEQQAPAADRVFVTLDGGNVQVVDF